MSIKNTIIVGNGESIFDKKNGLTIDSFETVIRCNSFKITGFEEYTGTKVDVIAIISSGAGCRAFNNSIDKKILKKSKELWFSRPKNICDKNHTQTLKKCSHQIIKYPSNDLFDKLCDRCKEIQKEEKKPSTGIVAIEMALDTMKESEIYITGFDYFETNHYYNKNKKIGRSHPSLAEKQIIEKYIKDNIIKKL